MPLYHDFCEPASPPAGLLVLPPPRQHTDGSIGQLVERLVDANASVPELEPVAAHSVAAAVAVAVAAVDYFDCLELEVTWSYDQTRWTVAEVEVVRHSQHCLWETG